MNKRQFLKTTLLSTAFAAHVGAPASAPLDSDKKKYKHWVWIRPDLKETDETIRMRYKTYYDAGISGVFFEGDSEKHFRAAKTAGMEAHRWIWTLNRGEASLLQAHPEWYAVNRIGESCADKPPYVQYYRWLCPSRDEVYSYLEKEVQSALSKNYVDGIHLDYVRYCDVILPVNLWENYGLDQTRELPEFDYCYCEICKRKFHEEYGVDLKNVEYPDQNLSWRNFRYARVTQLVNHLARAAKSMKKPISAAVFPTPEVARRIVRQDWTRWNLDAIYPMIYHGFYKEGVRWIGDAVAEGTYFLNGRVPLYAGLYIPDFKTNDELREGARLALSNGASGISLFGSITDDVLNAIADLRNR
jgi:hypothetical protein